MEEGGGKGGSRERERETTIEPVTWCTCISFLFLPFLNFPNPFFRQQNYSLSQATRQWDFWHQLVNHCYRQRTGSLSLIFFQQHVVTCYRFHLLALVCVRLCMRNTCSIRELTWFPRFVISGMEGETGFTSLIFYLCQEGELLLTGSPASPNQVDYTNCTFDTDDFTCLSF